jgi:hypothetical protein
MFKYLTSLYYKITNRTIFVVTTMVIKNEHQDSNIFFDNQSRVVGFFFRFKDAEKHVINNTLDIYEAGSNFVVIEECGQGFYNTEQIEHWYKWDEKLEKYKPYLKPTCYNCTISFGLG